MKNVSVVIPTFNGKELLREYIPSLKAAMVAYPGASEMIIVDNGSTDDSILFLTQHHPYARILKNRTNEGFGPAVNRGVRETKHEILLLLNNDIRVEADFIEPLVRHFDDPATFAVVSKSLVKVADRDVNESVTVPGFDGRLVFSHQPLVGDSTTQDITTACTNFHASGGFAAFDRSKFLKLGGFDNIYHPFYCEDVDLSYQAWKRGWQILYEPGSVVHHRSHATSLKVATQSYIDKIELRNRFLLTWKNISDPAFIASHLKWSLRILVSGHTPAKVQDHHYAMALRAALPRLPAILYHRIRYAWHTSLSDSRIFDLSANRETPILKFNRILRESLPPTTPGMRILLIDPPGYQKGLNLGLACLASSLKKNGFLNVHILDLNNVFCGISDERIADYFKQEKFDLIGVSIKTPTCNAAVSIARLIRNLDPNVPMIAGGPHVTLNHREFIDENREFDFAAVGEGDFSLIELCRMFSAGKTYPVTGIYSRRQGDSIPCKLTLIDKLDDLPLPDFDSFIGYDYTNFEYLLVTSRGCPYKCTYCSVGMISGCKMRYRDVETIISELKWAKNKFNCTRFNIIDDNFTLDIERAKHFCDRLIEESLGLGWACGNGIRADKVDAALARKMKQAGCNLVCVGVENADPTVFARIRKGETLDDIKRGIHLLKDAGIEVVGFFIVGLPADSRRSSEMALEFIKESRLDSARFGILLPYPGTEAYDMLSRTGTFLKNYKDGTHFSDKLSPVFETPEFPASEMVETYERLYTKLGYFTFLLPQHMTETERQRRILQLRLKYDKLGFLSRTSR